MAHQRKRRKASDARAREHGKGRGRGGRSRLARACRPRLGRLGARRTAPSTRSDDRVQQPEQRRLRRQRQRLGHRPGSSQTNRANGIYKYNPYPSQTTLRCPEHLARVGFYILDLQAAVDQSKPARSSSLNPTGARSRYSHPTSADARRNICYHAQLDAHQRRTPASTACRTIHVAIDNTNTYSKGRVYLSLTSPENDVEVVRRRPAAGRLPGHRQLHQRQQTDRHAQRPFGQVGYVAVDSQGNIYVTDWGEQVVDEFDSTGTFLRTFPDPSAEQGYPGSGRRRRRPDQRQRPDRESVYNKGRRQNSTPRATTSRRSIRRRPAAAKRRRPRSTRTATSTCRPAATSASSARPAWFPTSPTNRSPARQPPRAPSTRRSTPTAAATSPNASSNTAPPPPTAPVAALRPEPAEPAQLHGRRPTSAPPSPA